MAASTVLRGRPIALKVGATFICITKWNIDTAANKADVTNSCTEGTGSESVEGDPVDSGSFEGFMKSDKNIHASPPNLKRGQTLEGVIFYMDKNNPGLSYSGSIFLDRVSITGDIKSQFNFSVDFTFQGDVTYPTFA